MNNTCKVDTSSLERIFENLSEEKRKEVLFKSLTKGGQELVKETQQELLRVLPNAARGNKYGSPMVKGIKLTKDKDYSEVKVHIMGDYRLKFFEMGTGERYLRKPISSSSSRYKYKSGSTNTGGKIYRGKISPKSFFESARENSNIADTITSNLEKEINKLMG